MAHKILVTSDTHSVGINHQRFDTLGLRHRHYFKKVRVYRWLTSTQLHNIGVALVLDNGIKHTLHFIDGGKAPYIRVSETSWAAQVAGLGDFDERQAGMLLMIGT